MTPFPKPVSPPKEPKRVTFAVLLILALLPSALSAQRLEHWTPKVVGSGAVYVGLRQTALSPDLAAVLATVAPTVIGKALYFRRGVSGSDLERWPSLGFVARDIAGELCVQSAPLWIRLAKVGSRKQRVWRVPVAVAGYAAAVLVCGRMEVG